MKRLKVGIDWDDVIADLNPIACEMKNQREGTNLSSEDITDWDTAEGTFWDIYHEPELYARQTVTSEARKFIETLRTMCEVFIITRPFPEIYSIRREQIHKFFPEFDEWHIIITDDKTGYDFDYLIDDSINNLIMSNSKNKILWSQPWNVSCDDKSLIRCDTCQEILDIIRPEAMKRVSKSNYYLDVAKVVTERSTCLKRQYGAVIVNNDEIISTGYNGSPRGETNCCNNGYCNRMHVEHNSGNYSDCHSVHAEQNAIISASRKDMIGSTIYLFGYENGEPIRNAEPCPICERMIKNAGIKHIVTIDKITHL